MGQSDTVTLLDAFRHALRLKTVELSAPTYRPCESLLSRREWQVNVDTARQDEVERDSIR